MQEQEQEQEDQRSEATVSNLIEFITMIDVVMPVVHAATSGIDFDVVIQALEDSPLEEGNDLALEFARLMGQLKVNIAAQIEEAKAEVEARS